MDKKIIGKLAGATLGFLILLGIVTAIAWYFQEAGMRRLETIYVVIAFTPFVFYLFLSDKLKQFKGGGIEFTLRDEVHKEVKLDREDERIEYSEEIVNSKGGLDELSQMVQGEHPTTLTFQIGREGYYAHFAIDQYISKLSDLPSFKYVLFEDQDKKFKGYIHVNDFTKVIEKSQNIVPQIEDGGILQNHKVIKEAIQEDVTNKDALTKMDSLNISELAVVDSNKRFKGTITQDEIVRKVLTRVIREV